MMDKNIGGILKNLENQRKVLQVSMNEAFAGMPPEAQQKVKGPQMDVAKALKAIKEGNIDELYKLAK